MNRRPSRWLVALLGAALAMVAVAVPAAAIVSADLAITGRSVGPGVVGQKTNFSFTIKNNGAMGVCRAGCTPPGMSCFQLGEISPPVGGDRFPP